MADLLTIAVMISLQKALVRRTMCVLSVISQNGGSYVLAVDAGRERILSVWQWQWGHLLGKVAVSWPQRGSRKLCTEPRNVKLAS